MLSGEFARRAVTTARLLAVDAIEQANSGHPGAALSLAPVADTLFQNHVRHDPGDPQWIGRDRFVLSCGHASMLLYSQLFLTGYDVTLDDLKSFRTLHSRTPGHPEYGWTPGVDATTGPLGQGIAMAVGIAMAFAHQRALYDPQTPAGESPFDRHVWVLASDGDLQEGISYEAGAFAGRQQLGNLTVIYDDNEIQIDGATSLAWDEDVKRRFEAQGWEVSVVQRAEGGDIDVGALDHALVNHRTQQRPHLVVLKSEIAFPAPEARGTSDSHGSPLGKDEVEALRGELGVKDVPFEVDPDVLAYTRRAKVRGRELHDRWDQMMEKWSRQNPTSKNAWDRAISRFIPEDLESKLPVFGPGSKLSTRGASGKVIQVLAGELPDLMGGSADLATPNQTTIEGGGDFLPGVDRTGRNIHWGVREMLMVAAMNGISLAQGTRVYGGTFLVFSDYQRAAVRLAALMQVPTIFVWTHDSVALGQDGPTHQPIEHMASLRAMPGLTIIRPADPNETAAAWLVALQQRGPTGLIFCRQPLTTLDTPIEVVRQGLSRGGYVVEDDNDPEVILIGTGSELELAMASSKKLRESGRRVRVVSMPSTELFQKQSGEYQESVLPCTVRARVAIEAAATYGWREYVGDKGAVVGIDRFGESGPGDQVIEDLGMTQDNVIAAVNRVLG